MFELKVIIPLHLLEPVKKPFLIHSKRSARSELILLWSLHLSLVFGLFCLFSFFFFFFLQKWPELK